MTGGIKIEGISDINAVLSAIAPREAINLIRATVHDMAGQLAKEAKANMASVTDTGAMQKGTKAHKRRGTRTTVESNVAVAGAFHWRFLEYGQGPDGIEHAMFLKALEAMRPEVERVYMQSFGKKLAARLARERKARV